MAADAAFRFICFRGKFLSLIRYLSILTQR